MTQAIKIEPNVISAQSATLSIKPFLLTIWLIVSVIFCYDDLTADDKHTNDHFEQAIRPVLIESCIKCHGSEKQEGDLRLDSHESILKGGETGPAIVVNDANSSLLIQAIKHDGLEMPPDKLLSNKQIRDFEHWLNTGAVWPAEHKNLRQIKGGITQQDRNWWAFRPIVKPPVPEIGKPGSLNPIDAFVSSRLERVGIKPAPRAKKSVLVRRLYYDLIGLPPSPEQIKQFEEDETEDAWESLIDQLLNDRGYGEHWAQFWLDVVRYAESDGWNQDKYRTDIWKYRDYVVRSLNSDKPYPRFVREQLAGDELDGDDPEQLIATGFLRLGIYEYNQRDARGQWDDIVNEMTDVAGDVFLGLSMACARCHDHKFDPVMQADYFRLRAFFEPVVWRDDIPEASDELRESYRRQLVVWEKKTTDIRGDIEALLAPYNDKKWRSTVDKFPVDIQDCFHKPVDQRSSWEHQMAYLVSRQFLEEGGGPLKEMTKADKETHAALKKKLTAFDEYLPRPLPSMMSVSDFAGDISPTRIPGDPNSTSIEPDCLAVLEGPRQPSLKVEGIDASRGERNSTGRRTALANWIGDPKNGLTNRVIVNRIWKQHFGTGIVATPSDFGIKGSLPSHPELLDWLTATFVEQGGSFKKLHKTILMSESWQRDSFHPESQQYELLNPNDDLLWRFKVRRLSAEQIRDSMLMCSGELKNRIGGPGVDTKQPRRSLYVKRIRNTPDVMLGAFDVANGLKSVSVRDVTTTPIQSLVMINGDFVLDRSKRMAIRLTESNSNIRELLTQAFVLCWSRNPDEAEFASALEFLGIDPVTQSSKIDQEKLIDFCHTLLNSSEFLYLD